MTPLTRQYPAQMPAVFPVPEYRATGELKARYEDVKTVLQVPWMGVITMAFAHYPRFFGTLWQGLRPLCASAEYVAACQRLRQRAEDGAAALNPPPMAARLAALGYAERELDNIREVLEVFSHGNPLYVYIASAARLLLEGGELSANPSATPFVGRHAPQTALALNLLERHHADTPTVAIYDDIMATLRLPIVNTDYRALARWPSYFALAWSDLKPLLAQPGYSQLCNALHSQIADDLAHTLPNPGGLQGAALRAAADQDASVAEVLEVCRLFQWLLPGLISNVAVFHLALAGKP